MSVTKKLIDTNILVYAEERDDQEKNVIATSIIRELALSGHGVVSLQVCAEFSSVMQPALKSGKWHAADVNQRVSDYVSSLTMISHSIQEIKRANELCEQHGIHFFDGLLVATMLANEVTTIVTENVKDFKKIPGLTVENPFEKILIK